MTKDELLSRLQDIEWEDFEVKSASRELPKNIWESVSAFSNGSGGWIVFGVVQNGKKFEVEGVNNGEKIESDFLNTLRSGNKMNHTILPISKKYSIEGKTVLAFLYSIFTFKTSLVYEYNKYLHSLRLRRQTRNRNGGQCNVARSGLWY